MMKIKNAALRQEARNLILRGVSRKEASSRLSVNYRTISLWTEDLALPRHRDTGKQIEIFEKIKADGFYIAKGTDDLNTLRILRHRKGIKIVHAADAHIGILSGREFDALKGLLDYRYKHGLTKQRLEELGRAFGVKEKDKLKGLLVEKQSKTSDSYNKSDQVD